MTPQTDPPRPILCRSACRLGMVLALAAPAWADPVPGVTVDQAYALVRDTMLDFTSPPEAMLARLASQPGGTWDYLPLIIDDASDPQAMRLRLALELDAGGNASLTARQVDCTRLGPAGLAAVNGGQAIMPSQLLGTAPDPQFNDMAEAMALPQLAFAASELAPDATGAVMQCTLTIALSPGEDPVADLKTLATPDFARVETASETALAFTGGKAGADGTVVQFIVSVPEVDGQRFLYLTAFSTEARPGS